MTREKAIDTFIKEETVKTDITNSTIWRNEHIDRLAAWEMLCRYIKHDHTVPMSNRDMCDRIAMPKDLIRKTIESIKDRENGQ